MRSDFRQWLEAQEYAPNVANSRFTNAKRIEEFYGDLQSAIENGSIRAIEEELRYTKEDERRNKPNPSKIPIVGNIYNNLATYRGALALYKQFIADVGEKSSGEGGSAVPPPLKPVEPTISLERDLQVALRRNIQALGSSLTIIDGGIERYVDTGFIDITCEDSNDGSLVVVELKAGKAPPQALTQILGYMSNVRTEEAGRSVRGILVAHDFDDRLLAASSETPNVILIRYSVEFKFERP